MMPGTPAQLCVFDTPAQTYRAAAEAIIEAGKSAIAQQGSFSFVLAGGNTPRRLYERLASQYTNALDWRRVTFFWGDERCVPPTDEASNYRMAHESLLAPLEVPESQVFRIRAERTDADAVARDYERTIARVLGAPQHGPPPAFDLVLLGLGADGHTASLFPHTPALREEKRWVVVNSSPDAPVRRITMTPRLLNRAKRVYFLVTGRGKAAALAQVLEGRHDPNPLPAQLIRPEAGPAVCFCDRGAATRARGGK